MELNKNLPNILISLTVPPKVKMSLPMDLLVRPGWVGIPSETSLGKVEPSFVVSWKKVSNASEEAAREQNCTFTQEKKRICRVSK